MLTQISNWIRTNRTVKAVQVPDGNEVLLHEGTEVSMVHALGGDYCVRDRKGVNYRIDGGDADALNKTSTITPSEFEGPFREAWVLEQLHRCYDPEIPVDIVEMGLVYSHSVHKGTEDTYDITVLMTLTAPGCGMGQVMVNDVKRKLGSIPFVGSVHVELTFDPPWDPSRMSEGARLAAGLV